MSLPTTSAQLWHVIIPVKLIAVAKSRLSPLGPDLRQRLAVAFALDVVAAARACPAVTQVVVVSNDPVAPQFAALGADVVADVPDAGLNPALVHAAQHIRAAAPDAAVAALSSDLASLDPETLTRAFDAAPDDRGWFVADAHGVGTTLLGAPSGVRWQPHFGHHSRAWHRDRGMTEVDVPGLERLRRDVDTEVDLWDARRLGVGPSTARALDAADRDTSGLG